MILDIDLNNPKSVKESLAKLQRVRNGINKMVNRYLHLCCSWLESRAEYYIKLSGIGDDVVEELSNQWTTKIRGDKATLINGEGRGYILEFGTGVYGEQKPSKEALRQGYTYNYDTGAKNEDGEWSFYIEDYNELDIPHSSDYTVEISKNKHVLRVKTTGATGILFMHNALRDFYVYGHYKRLWQELKAEVIR